MLPVLFVVPSIRTFTARANRPAGLSFTIVGAMHQAGAPIELHYLPKGGHGYGMRRGAGKLWPKLAELWLKGF